MIARRAARCALHPCPYIAVLSSEGSLCAGFLCCAEADRCPMALSAARGRGLDAAPFTPRWAFLPWISKDISDTADTYDFVDGFKKRDIPVGTVVLDSPWETNYNSFSAQPHALSRLWPAGDGSACPRRAHRFVDYAAHQYLVLRSRTGGDKYAGPTENYQPAKACGYFVNDAESFVGGRVRGSAIDFFNPSARAYWHRQQDSVLGLGIDGWKLDFGESYIAADPLTTAAGEKRLQRNTPRPTIATSVRMASSGSGPIL